MIEFLTLENFQRFDHKRLDFDKFVTILSGRSDSGKSTVLRALKWLSLNKPTGDRVIRRDWDSGKASKECQVKAQVDGKEVRRDKGNENAYWLEGVTEPYKAFGTNVPEPVERFLNLSDVNFAGQHDAPLWFAASPGEVSRQLNAIVNLDLIDGVLAAATAEVRKAKGEVELTRERLRIAKARKASLQWTVQAVEGLQRLQALRDKANGLQEQVKRLRELAATVQQSRAMSDRAQVGLRQGQIALRLGEKVEGLQGRIERLRRLANEVLETRTAATTLRIEFQEAEHALQQQLGDRCPLCGARGRKAG